MPKPKNSSLSGKKRQREDYDATKDNTLTKRQAASAAFVPENKRGKNFRAKSNRTLLDTNSGYHEVITTDTFYFLNEATDNNDGTDTLPRRGLRSYYGKHSGEIVYTQNKKIILDIADGFRTDTNQTIISTSSGSAAGHSGSNVSLKGQADAHNLLRKAILKIVQTDPTKTKGVTEESISTIVSAISVTSMAPGELARKVPNSKSLKNPEAIGQWESNRNEGKRRTIAMFEPLSKDEKSFVLDQAKEFMDSTQVNVPQNRSLDGQYPVSPKRSRKKKKTISGNIVGGGYKRSWNASKDLPEFNVPTDFKQRSLFATQTNRTKRRK